jgi:hypothetical protein
LLSAHKLEASRNGVLPQNGDFYLLEHVWHRLEGRALLDREDLRESIGQLQNGDVAVLRPPAGTDDK